MKPPENTNSSVAGMIGKILGLRLYRRIHWSRGFILGNAVEIRQKEERFTRKKMLVIHMLESSRF